MGNLRHSAIRILTGFSLLMPAFSLRAAPQCLTALLQCNTNAPLPHSSSGRGNLNVQISTSNKNCVLFVIWNLEFGISLSKGQASMTSVTNLSPVHFRRRLLIPVSCYAIFKGWLLLSQPPGCLKKSTSFALNWYLGTLVDGLGCFPLDETSLARPV